jgi:hypothetical protein
MKIKMLPHVLKTIIWVSCERTIRKAKFRFSVGNLDIFYDEWRLVSEHHSMFTHGVPKPN